MRTLPEIAASIAPVVGEAVDVVHASLRGYRDKGFFSHSDFKGRAALYDDSVVGRICVLLALVNHGFEGVALSSIVRLLDKHDAPIEPGIAQPVGFTRVVDGIKAGEQWTFRFSALRRKTFQGSCRIAGSDSYDSITEDRETVLGFNVVTTINLNAIIPFRVLEG